jgi:hypothetical protein
VSPRLSHPLLTGSAAALALVLAVPSAALAADHDTSSHNPPGNNGTIKIDYAAPADSGHANRPHPGCAFQLRMFNFDDDQYGTVTFVGQAPTKLGTLLTQSHVLLSDDAAGGGQDVDAVYSYTSQQLGLVGRPQAKQGWHVKVLVDADNAPGGAKQKVFWLDCPTPTVRAGSTVGAGTAPTKSTVTTTSVPAAPSTTTEVSSLSAGRRAAARPAAQPVSQVALSGGREALKGAPASAAARSSALPFTGLALASLLVLAVGALLAGALAIRAGRRRTTQA